MVRTYRRRMLDSRPGVVHNECMRRGQHDEFMGAQEAADFLGVSEATLWRLRVVDEAIPEAGVKDLRSKDPSVECIAVVYSRVDLQKILDKATAAGYKKGTGMHLRRFLVPEGFPPRPQRTSA